MTTLLSDAASNLAGWAVSPPTQAKAMRVAYVRLHGRSAVLQVAPKDSLGQATTPWAPSVFNGTGNEPRQTITFSMPGEIRQQVELIEEAVRECLKQHMPGIDAIWSSSSKPPGKHLLPCTLQGVARLGGSCAPGQRPELPRMEALVSARAPALPTLPQHPPWGPDRGAQAKQQVKPLDRATAKAGKSLRHLPPDGAPNVRGTGARPRTRGISSVQMAICFPDSFRFACQTQFKHISLKSVAPDPRASKSGDFGRVVELSWHPSDCRGFL